MNDGGGWASGAAYCRSALRSTDGPSYRSTYLGFRLALSPSGAPPVAGKGNKRSHRAEPRAERP
jgi:hypothetical protein